MSNCSSKKITDTRIDTFWIFFRWWYDEFFLWLAQSCDYTCTPTFSLSRYCMDESRVHLCHICAWNGSVRCVIRHSKPLRHAWHINLIPQSKLQNIYITHMTVDITWLSRLKTTLSFVPLISRYYYCVHGGGGSHGPSDICRAWAWLWSWQSQLSTQSFSLYLPMLSLYIDFLYYH